ncbi:YiiD C-terminal domain-containing protein [Mycobacteroides salmoniphilum]|uniref:YiiD C-terminal domain-containing protein n=1 Tax=Mycobacteroides salmoniphilum TaxID=404941 RepID=UPI001F3A8394|nr:YiiD C-terminal domain-containing protein [Mycobacteroides salmoniphilum]
MIIDAAPTSDSENLAESVNQMVALSVPPIHHMGVTALHVAPGSAVSMVPLKGNTNHIGTIYAGVLFTLAESVGGALAIGTFDMALYYPVVKGFNITYRKPARSEVRAEARIGAKAVAEITVMADQIGKADFDFDIDCELLDTAGVVVATSRGRYQLRRHGT